MPTTSAEKIRTPAGGDFYAISTDLRLMGESIRSIVPVANTTERDAVVSAMTAASRPPTTSNPLYVHRDDATTGMKLEYTVDGTNWHVLGGRFGHDAISADGSGNATITHGLGYAPTSVQLQVSRVGSGSDDVARLAAVIVLSVTSTVINVVVYRRDTNAVFASNTVGVDWRAV